MNIPADNHGEHEATTAPPVAGPRPPPGRSWHSLSGLWHRKTTIIAGLSIVGITQEVIDVLAVLNTLRAAFPPLSIRDL